MRDRMSRPDVFSGSLRAAALAAVLVAAPVRAGENPLLVSVNAAGAACGDSFSPAISGSGRYVAFLTELPDVVPGVGNGFRQIYLRDMVLQATEVVSVSSSGVLADEDCTGPYVTPDGRYVAFSSQATNLSGVAGWQVRDRQAGTTLPVGIQGGPLMLSDDGQLALFRAKLFGQNSVYAIGLKDLQAQTLEIISVNSAGVKADKESNLFTHNGISADNRYVVFTTHSSNLAPVGFFSPEHVYVRDRVAHTTTLVSATADGVLANDDCREASISADGRFVGFHTHATNLAPLSKGPAGQVYVRDLQKGALELVSVSNAGEPNDDGPGMLPIDTYVGLSADGRFVAFRLYSRNLVPGLPLLPEEPLLVSYVRDRLAGLTWAASIDASGRPKHGAEAALSRSGRGSAFTSVWPFSQAEPASQFIPNDVYVHDRLPWTEIEPALPGAGGEPRLVVQGAPEALAPLMLAVTHGLAGGTAMLVIGMAEAGIPFKGGVLVPVPTWVAPLPLDTLGLSVLNLQWPPGIPGGVEFFLQAWISDPAGPHGFTATNGVANKSQ